MMAKVCFSERHCVVVARHVFFTADTLTIRLLLAAASFFYALLLLWPIAIGGPHLFERPAYALMAYVPGGELTWGALFFAHFIGVHWRALDPVRRVNWGLAVNILGTVIWAYSTASINLGLRMLSPTTALEWTMVAASAWALYRTGMTREFVSP